LYFLLAAGFVGAFLLLFRQTSVLPLEADEANAAFQIIIPVFVAQVVVIFQWLAKTDDAAEDQPSPFPNWAIVLPPVLTLAIFIVAVVALAVSNGPGAAMQVSPDAFQSAVTLSVTILNASTVLLVTRLFPGSKRKPRPVRASAGE
jgi:hypothetical protein